MKKNPVHVTDTEFSPIPSEVAPDNLRAASLLFGPRLFNACAPLISEGIMALRRINGTIVPSFCIRDDMLPEGSNLPLEFVEQLYMSDVNGIRSQGVNLDWGTGQTISTELIAAHSLDKITPLQRLTRAYPRLTLGIEPGYKGIVPGDIVKTRHPFTPSIIKNLGGLTETGEIVGNPRTMREVAAGIIQATGQEIRDRLPKLKIHNFNAIAPTPGTVGQAADFAFSNLHAGGRANFVLTTIHADRPELLKAREEDLNVLSTFLRNGQGTMIFIAANALIEMQRGNFKHYNHPTAQVLERVGPFDTKYSASGAALDNRSIDNNLQIVTISPRRSLW